MHHTLKFLFFCLISASLSNLSWASTSLPRGAEAPLRTLGAEELREIEALEQRLTSRTQATSHRPSEEPQASTKRQLRRERRIQRLANSKLVQWLVKRKLIRQERKKLRQELRKVKGDRAARAQLREEYKQKVLDLNRNIRIGLIVVIIGIIVTLLPGSFLSVIGGIIIIVGLVFILFGLI